MVGDPQRVLNSGLGNVGVSTSTNNTNGEGRAGSSRRWVPSRSTNAIVDFAAQRTRNNCASAHRERREQWLHHAPHVLDRRARSKEETATTGDSRTHRTIEHNVSHFQQKISSRSGNPLRMCLRRDFHRSPPTPAERKSRSAQPTGPAWSGTAHDAHSALTLRSLCAHSAIPLCSPPPSRTGQIMPMGR